MCSRLAVKSRHVECVCILRTDVLSLDTIMHMIAVENGRKYLSQIKITDFLDGPTLQ